MTEKFWTPPRLARILGVGPDQILSFIRAGELKAVNTSLTGRARWKIDPRDLQKFLDARSNQKPEPTTRRKQSASTCVREYV